MKLALKIICNPSFIIFRKCIIGGLILLTVSSCTSSRWVIEDKNAVDPNNYRLISSTPELVQQHEITPNNPLLTLAVYHKNTYQYKEKVLTERLIQEYRPRWVYTTLSLLSGSILFYASHSDKILQELTETQIILLNTFAGVIALSPILNMKPVGDPINTGETQFRRVTGTRQVTKLEKSGQQQINQIRYSMVHQGDSLIKNEKLKVRDSLIHFNLVKMVNPDLFDQFKPDSIELTVSYNNQQKNYNIGVSQFLTPYVRVQTEFSELHNTPSRKDDNVLTELGRNSMLELVEPISKDWYKVKFGIKNTYISQSDVRVVWRPESFEQRNSIITLENIPFGEIDVESNVPVLRQQSPSGLGLLISSEEYENDFSTWKYAQRDARLMELYWSKSLEYPENNIYRLFNFKTPGDVSDQLDRLEQHIHPDTTLFSLYISGHAVVRERDGMYNYYLVPAGITNPMEADSSQLVDLERIFQRLSQLRTHQTVIWVDLKFHHRDNLLNEPENVQIIRPLASIARNLTEVHTRSAVIFSSTFNQNSNIYYQKGGVDKKHRIFPYYVARAFQQRITSMEKMMNFLERNVNYTSRKLHDEPQNPQFFGNSNISFAPKTSP